MLEWDDFPKVEIDFMNTDHKECLEMLTELSALCSQASEQNEVYAVIDEKLQALQQHLVEHFKREEQAMEATAFPPYYVHKTEHEATLQQFQQVLTDWQRDRDLGFLTRYIENNMMNWLELHAITMDTVTARHVAQNS